MKLRMIFLLLITSLIFAQIARAASSIQGRERGKIMDIRLSHHNRTNLLVTDPIAWIVLDVENPDITCQAFQYENGPKRGYTILNTTAGRMHLSILTAAKLNGSTVSIEALSGETCILGTVFY